MSSARPRAPSSHQLAAAADLVTVDPVAAEAARLFGQAGHEIALVGGPVRDALLGRGEDAVGDRADLDLTTSARPHEVAALLRPWADAVWETGIAFGTVGARRGGRHLEVTTYRSDAYDPGSRKPAVEFGDSLEGDLVRRDFTINAVALRLPGRELIDPSGGLLDIAARVLRTPSAPEVSFSDDPLRMLRAARFVAQLGFSVVPEAMAAMQEMAERLAIVSAERVRDELTKLLLASDPNRGLRVLVGAGLADVVLPELPRLQLEIDEHHRHKDVYEHTLTVLEQAIDLEDGGPDLTLRLAALMHDVGKPKTRALLPGGGVSFHHHEVVGAHLTRTRLRTLRFPREVVDDVSRLVELHLRFHGYGSGEWTDSAVRRYVRDAGPLLERLHRLTRSDSTTRNRRRAAALARSYDALEERIAQLREAEELDRIRPDLDGHEIMSILDVGPGPVVGKAYQHLLAVRMERGPLSRDEAVAELLSWRAAHPEADSGSEPSAG